MRYKISLPLLLFLLTAIFLSCKERSAETVSDGEKMTATEPVVNQGTDVQTFFVVPETSVLYWEGYKPALGVTHHGTVRISKGRLSVQDGLVTAGAFEIDMTSITSDDQEGQSKDRLEAHLKGTAPGKENDFFHVNMYPTATFEITRTASLTGDAESNTLIYGNLTIKGVTKNIGFKANVDLENGKCTAVVPLFKLDRTEWRIHILSKRFVEGLKDNFVSDEFGMRIQLHAVAGKDI